jgi:hypothetical protein
MKATQFSNHRGEQQFLASAQVISVSADYFSYFVFQALVLDGVVPLSKRSPDDQYGGSDTVNVHSHTHLLACLYRANQHGSNHSVSNGHYPDA